MYILYRNVYIYIHTYVSTYDKHVHNIIHTYHMYVSTYNIHTYVCKYIKCYIHTYVSSV